MGLALGLQLYGEAVFAAGAISEWDGNGADDIGRVGIVAIYVAALVQGLDALRVLCRRAFAVAALFAGLVFQIDAAAGAVIPGVAEEQYVRFETGAGRDRAKVDLRRGRRAST